MRIGTFLPQNAALSMRRYTERITEHLSEKGVEIVLFGRQDDLPQDVDLYWDPRVGGGNPPYSSFKAAKKPLIMTLHGATFRTDAMRNEIWSGIRRPLLELFILYRLFRWRTFREKVRAVITVSDFSASLIPDALSIPAEKIHTIYHGVDHRLFAPIEPASLDTNTYFLSVSDGFGRRKNVERIVAAYHAIQLPNKPRLRLILAGYTGSLPFDVEQIDIIRESLSHPEITLQYQNAFAFVYPSLSESFGMPILEAMASGCPVITSNDTACVEVAGDAALLVNPRSVEAIQNAMTRLIEDKNLWLELRNKGLERASQFSWKQSASEHLAIFEQILRDENHSS